MEPIKVMSKTPPTSTSLLPYTPGTLAVDEKYNEVQTPLENITRREYERLVVGQNC